MDDAAYLETAVHLLGDPVHGLQQPVNWEGTPQPAHALNQPPLLSYFLALTIRTLGDSALVLHLAFSLFTALALIGFGALDSRISQRGLSPMNLLMFGVGAYFLPAQNLMTDVPLLAFSLLAIGALTGSPPRYRVAGCLIALACLTKYTGVVLMPAAALVALARREIRPGAFAVAIPGGALIAWSLFTLWDHGGVHMFERPTLAWTPGLLVLRLAGLFVAIGAVAPFAWLMIPSLLRSGSGRVAVMLTALLFVMMAYAGIQLWHEDSSTALLRALFLSQSLILVAGLVRWLLSGDAPRSLSGAPLALFVSASATLVFVWLFAPFVAVRHVMLVMAAAQLILVRPALAQGPSVLRWTAIAATLVLGLTLAHADWHLADTYRDFAQRTTTWAQPPTHFVGHWGWQWYAKRAGLLHLSTNDLTSIPPGGLIAVPRLPLMPAEWQAVQERLTLQTTIPVPRPKYNPVRVMNPYTRLGYYHSNAIQLPWYVGTGVGEEFRLFTSAVSALPSVDSKIDGPP